MKRSHMVPGGRSSDVVRSWPMIRTAAVCACTLSAPASIASGGTWADSNSQFNGFAQAYYIHRDPDPPSHCNALIDCQEPPDDPMGNPPPPITGWIQNFWGFSFGRLAEAKCVHKNTHPQGTGCPYFGGKALAQTLVDGIGTSTVRVVGEANASARNNCECLFDDPLHPGALSRGSIGAIAKLDTTVDLEITSVPPGDPVDVYFSWYSLANRQTRHEMGDEDPACVANVIFEVNGTAIIPPGSANLGNCNPPPDGPNALLFLPPQGSPSTGVISAHGGDVITVRIVADVEAHIAPPPQIPFMQQDQAFAAFFVDVTLSIDEPLPPYQNPIHQCSHEFSLAIGSDAEMSDPNFDGNEVFDPGDTYPWFGSPLPQGGASGFRDDVLAFNTDFWPIAPDLNPNPTAGGTGAETCLHPPADVPTTVPQRFDLNGTAALDTELRFIIPPDQALDTPIQRFPSDCIHLNPPFVLISYKDASEPHYAWDACLQSPVNSFPASGIISGTDSERDEVLMLSTLPVWPPVTPTPETDLTAIIPLLSESALHPNLAPSPLDPFTISPRNNDVNALNVNINPSCTCPTWYITPSHEATATHPAVPGLQLDPGNVYEVLPLGGIVKVIDHAHHLGLPDGVDINAFDFIWLRQCDPANPTSCTDSLAMLFSVEADDFLVAGDQTGGLNPNVIYASFLTGSHFEYITDPLPGNVDAIAASPLPFAPITVQSPPNETCSSATTIGLGDPPLNFTNANAVTDGPAEPNCGFTGIDDGDVWFEYVATESCEQEIHVARVLDPNEPLLTHMLAVYHSVCPQAGGALLGCDVSDINATVTFNAVAGETYIIRIGTPGGVTNPSGSQIKITTNCDGDANDDCQVNVDDLLVVLNNWGSCTSITGSCTGTTCDTQSPGGCWCDDLCFSFGDCCPDVCMTCSHFACPLCDGDHNKDGQINVDDLLIVLNNWGTCP